MKFKVRWEYSYMTTHVFEEIVDAQPFEPTDAGDEDFLSVVARDGATSVPNGDLKPVETYYPGDPVDEVLSVERVPHDAEATIRYRDGDDPEILTEVA